MAFCSRSLRAPAAAAILLAGSCSSLNGPAGQVSSQALEIKVRIESAPHPDSATVHAEFTNTGLVPIALSQTFGFGEFAWIGIRIRDEDGKNVQFYVADEDIFHNPPYRCIRPGEGMSWSIDLWEWRTEVGGSKAQENDSYTFSPSSGRYELQVQYTGSGEVAGDCREIQGIARSNWVPFEVRR